MNSGSPLGIKLLVPDMPSCADLAPYLERIDQSHWYSNFGPLVQQLEAQLAREHFGGKCAVTVSSGTAGLELALAALQLPPRSRVLVPDFTFVATAAAVLRSGLQPTVADVDQDSWSLTPDLARRCRQTMAIDAVMPVATFGCPQDAQAWDAFSVETGIPVVIDAAGAFGNQAIGDVAHVVFSLHATKALAAGEGGIVVSADRALLERVRRLSNFGIDRQTGIVDSPGINAKLSEYHAAVALAGLARWEPKVQRLRGLWKAFVEELEYRCPALSLQSRPAAGIYMIAPVLLPERVAADAVMSALSNAGIESRRWYHPLISDHPGFAGIELSRPAPVARRLSGSVLGLPFHSGLTREHFQRIFSVVSAAVAEQGGG